MSHITFMVYVTSSSVMKKGATREGRRELAENIKAVGASKAFLEVWRSARQTDPGILEATRDVCVDAGLEVATGLMPSHGGNLGGNSRWGADHCYSKPQTREALRTAVEAGARLFDEFIIDDALTTQCTCHRCREAKGDRSWPEFWRDSLHEVSRVDIVEAARAVNPDIHLILKFPQWYDRLAEFGYDTDRQTMLFDATWIGTETRDPDTARYGWTPQYEGCFNALWHAAAEPNLSGGWFDFGECTPTLYVEQAYQTAFGKQNAMMLFCYNEHFENPDDEFMSRLRGARPELETIADAIDGAAPAGVVTVRPHNPDPHEDGYLFDALGWMGMPLVPLAEFPENPPVAMLLTAHVAQHASLAARVRDVVDAGGTVFLTTALMAERDNDRELAKLAGLGVDGWVQRRKWTSDAFVIDGARITGNRLVDWRFDIRVEEAEMLAGVLPVDAFRGADVPVPVITRQGFPSGGAVVILNLYGADESDYTFSEPINVPTELAPTLYPEPVVNAIQEEVARSLGFGVIAPQRVSFHPYANGVCGLQSFRDTPVLVRLRGTLAENEQEELLGRAELVRGSETRGVFLPPRSAALLRAQSTARK